MDFNRKTLMPLKRPGRARTAKLVSCCASAPLAGTGTATRPAPASPPRPLSAAKRTMKGWGPPAACAAIPSAGEAYDAIEHGASSAHANFAAAAQPA
jgi:hypothetical protein